MATPLYPHLTVVVEVDQFFNDLAGSYDRTNHDRIRKEVLDRSERMDRWFSEHGYQCGRDYQTTHDGYRFANESLATMFTLAWTR